MNKISTLALIAALGLAVLPLPMPRLPARISTMITA